MLTLQLNNLGLFTYNNTVGQVPPGAMAAALNIVIDKPGVAETRRGFKQFGTPISLPASTYVDKFFSFASRLLIHYSTTLAYDSTGSGAFVSYGGTFVPPSGERMRSFASNGNLYLTTNNGIYKIDSLTNNPYAAGGVAGLDVTGAVGSTASGFLANNFSCAYRITFLYTDANGNQIEGTPSESVIFTNASGNPQNVDLVFTVPTGLSTSYSYRLYRTVQVASGITPSDTFQLAYQTPLTAGQIAALQVSVTDVTPDNLLGTLLYTSPGAQGQFQTNDPPPLCNDACTFLGMAFYFNATTTQQFYITVISVGAPNGLVNGDTVSLVGTSTHVYTGAATNDFTIGQFAVITGGTVATNIDSTTRNLVSAINRDPLNTEFYAYYVSGFNQLPGQVLIKARDISHAIFYGLSSRTTAFNPTLPTSGTSYASANNEVEGGCYVSKLNQPEAVPATNLIPIGNFDNTIYRGYALRDAVIVETVGGVFRITGTSPANLSVTPFDNTVVQYGNETGVTLNNSVYSFTTQGIISVSESGSQIMSRNIEGDLLTLATPSLYTNFPTLSFGISYESDRKYILFLQEETTDTFSTLQYVYNWITQAFTTWDIDCSAGIVNPADNRLYLAGSDGQILQERKNYNASDYVDREYTVTITSSSGLNVVLNSVANAVVGYTLAQNITNGQPQFDSVITAVDTMTNTVTVKDIVDWDPSMPGGLYQPIDSSLTYTPLTCGYPNYLKQMQPILSFVFNNSSFDQATATFTTDLYPSEETVTLFPKITGGWGTFPWGTLPWGVGNALLQSVPCFLTKNTLYAHWWNISVEVDQAFQNMALGGIFGFFDIRGERYR